MQTYNMLYQISKWFFIIAGFNFLAALIVISCGWKHYLEDINTISVDNTFVKFIVALLVPVIYGLGWVFFVPGVIRTAFFKKGK